MTRSLLLAGTVGLCLIVPVSHAAGAAGTAEAAEVAIVDYKFIPSELKVSRGTTVKWLNKEKRTSHSILFLEPGASESDRLFPGDTWSRTFDKPGTYPYRCGPHEEMKGRIVVTE